MKTHPGHPGSRTPFANDVFADELSGLKRKKREKKEEEEDMGLVGLRYQ